MKRLLLAFITITLVAGRAAAQEPVKLSLNDCMEYAMKHNYTVKNSQLDIDIQRAQVAQQVSAAYPHISGKVELDDYLNPQQSIIDGKYFGAPGTEEKIAFTLPYGGSASINGSQVLFDGSVLIALKARKTVVESARLSGEVTKETVRYNIYKAYNSLVIAYRQYDILKASLENAEKMNHDLQVTYENGFAEKIDVERSTVQVNNLATSATNIATLINSSEQALKFQIGMDMMTPIVLTDTMLEQRKEGALNLLAEQEQYERLPEYNLLTTGQKLNGYNLERYRLAALPSLSAFGAMGYNYPTATFGHLFVFPNYLFNSVIGLQLNVPIFSGFLRTNQVKEAKLNISKTQNNIDNLKLATDFQTEVSRNSLKNAILNTHNQRKNIELADDVLNLAQKKYKAGVGSNLEVTSAETDKLQAQNSYFSSLLDLINAEADLKKALGLLK